MGWVFEKFQDGDIRQGVRTEEVVYFQVTSFPSPEEEEAGARIGVGLMLRGGVLGMDEYMGSQEDEGEGGGEIPKSFPVTLSLTRTEYEEMVVGMLEGKT